MPEDKKNIEVPTLESYHYFLLCKEIDMASAEEVIKFILERNLMLEDRPSEIRLILNSPGGETQSAFAITDVMEASSIPIWTYGLGNLQSAALAIFIAGKKGHRYITKNTSILSHQFAWMTVGKEHELVAAKKEIDLTTLRVQDHYKKYTKQPITTIKKVLLPPQDVWLSANEAKKYGCADVIMKEFKP
jgi:ATP-dependent Clp endopeptidase proteolytic subunit ClpP